MVWTFSNDIVVHQDGRIRDPGLAEAKAWDSKNVSGAGPGSFRQKLADHCFTALASEV